MGRHLAQRLVADGESVVDVPVKLSARARVFSTGQGRKTDATDAHSVAVVALRTPGLRVVQVDDATVALRLLADRRDELGAARTLTVNRLHRLLVELIPGGAKTFLSATQAKALLATVRPRDVVGRTRRKVIASPMARNLSARAGRLVAAALHTVTSTVARIGASVLSWFGSPGRNVAARIGSAARSVAVRAMAVLAPVVRAVRAALDVRSTAIRTVGAVARERAVGRLLGSVLPQPWAAITRLLAGVLLLPATVRQQAAALLVEGLERVIRPRVVDTGVVVSTEPPTGGAAPTAPRFSTTATGAPVTTPVSPAGVPERDEDWPGVQLRLDEQLDNTEGVEPPRRPARYPAAAKRNSGPRR